MRTHRLVATMLIVFTIAGISESCPLCNAPSFTLTELVDSADAAILVQWASAKKGKDQQPGSTVYTILDVAKGGSTSIAKGKQITLVRYRSGRKTDLFLFTGSKASGAIEWDMPIDVSRASWEYVIKAPKPSVATPERIKYFVKFLEHPEQLIANDAYGEFALAPYKEIASVSKSFPRDDLRKWLADSNTPPTRVGLYGLLLGLCGDKDDAKLMKQKMLEPTEDFRLGIDGVMAGYMLLTGEKGLDVIDETKLKRRWLLDANGDVALDDNGEKKPFPFSETYAAMQAIRFMWTYVPGRISKERLRQSLRILLDRPELSDLVIADLSRWQDWSVQDRLMGLYGKDDYNVPSIKRAIVRYMIVSTKFKPQGSEDELPPRVAKGKKYLAELRKKDPNTVRDAERFYFPN